MHNKNDFLCMKFLELLCQLISQPAFDFDIPWLNSLKKKNTSHML